MVIAKDKVSTSFNRTVIGADAIFYVTEWKEFRVPDWKRIKNLMNSNPVLFDGRNIFDSKDLVGIEYYRIG